MLNAVRSKGKELLGFTLLVLALALVLGSCGGSAPSGGATTTPTTAETSSTDHMTGMTQGGSEMQGMAMGMKMADPASAGLTVDFTSDPAEVGKP